MLTSNRMPEHIFFLPTLAFLTITYTGVRTWPPPHALIPLTSLPGSMHTHTCVQYRFYDIFLLQIC